MEVSPERKLAVVPPPPEDAAWRLLDAVWDVPVGLGLCDRQLSFIRVNEALAGFDGLSVDAHYAEDSLARLPAEFRAALLLRAEGGLSFREIAEVLDLTEETARWRVFKARQKLMKVLSPELLPPGATTGEM